MINILPTLSANSFVLAQIKLPTYPFQILHPDLKEWNT